MFNIINKHIRTLFYTELILEEEKHSTRNILKKYYNNDILHIEKDEIKIIKQDFNLDNNQLIDMISYMFINDIFTYPLHKIILDKNYIYALSNELKSLNIKVIDNNPSNLNNNQLSKKILGYIPYINNHDKYNDIIKYCAEEHLIKNEPTYEDNLMSYKTFNKVINNIIDNNEDISSANIKKYIDIHKNNNIHDYIDMLLPIAIISKYKPKNILNLNNDYGEWLYASYLFNIEHLISMNSNKMDDASINNIKNLFENNKTNVTYDVFNKKNLKKIDLAFIDFSLLYEHDYNNFTYIIENDYLDKLHIIWQSVIDNGLLLLNIHDKENKNISEFINSRIINNLNGCNLKGILFMHKFNNLYPIWVFNKTI